MRKKVVGGLPVNSRITIDYTKDEKNPDIIIDYPPDSDAVKQSELGVSQLLGMLCAAILIFFILFYSMGVTDKKMYNCKSEVTSYESGRLNDLYLNCTDMKGKNISFSAYIDYNIIKGYDIQGYRNDVSINRKLVQAFGIFFGIIGLFIVSIIVFSKFFGLFFRKTKIGLRLFPTLNAKTMKNNFSLELDELNSTTFELPLFKNIYMNYYTEGDFAENLQKIIIVEHPFMKNAKKRGKEIKKHNVWLWKATFIFKAPVEKKPENKFRIEWT